MVRGRYMVRVSGRGRVRGRDWVRCRVRVSGLVRG